MVTKQSFSFFISRLLSLSLNISPSSAYSSKSCTILYQENPLIDVSLDCTKRNLVTIPDDIPKEAVSVDLYRNRLQIINKEDFREMQKLMFLSSMRNYISQVDDGSFSDLTSLKFLSIRNNQLTNSTSNMFQGLANLTVLDLQENQIEFIDDSAFRFSISLDILDLGDNQLQKVTDIIPILQLPQIRRLSISCCQLSSFETKDLPSNLSSTLQELDVSGVYSEKFSITTFIFPYLQKLDLSVCGTQHNAKWDDPDKTLSVNITQLYFNARASSFEDARELSTSLSSLRHSQLSQLFEWLEKASLSTVCKIPTLRRSDLSDNILDNIPTELSTCSQSTESDSSVNVITDLPKGSIQPMKLSESLNMSKNLLSRVPQDVRSFTCLKILDSSSNRIFESTCEDFENATHLTELYLNTNRIAKSDMCVVQNLNDLKRLDSSNNSSRTFGDTFKFALQNSEFLDMTDTSIPSLKYRKFQSLSSLKQLNAGTYFFEMGNPKTLHKWNNFTSISHKEPIVFGLQKLENFTFKFIDQNSFPFPNLNMYDDPDFSFKSLKKSTAICFGDHAELPYNIPTNMLRRMEHLEIFSAVNIYAFPPDADMFEFNTQLKSSTFAETDLSNLNPDVFRPIPKLHSSDLSKSKLKSLDFSVRANLSALRYLRSSNNELSVINETVFHSLPSLTYLDMSNNPFACECSNAGFIRWAKKNKQTQVANTHQYICSFPVNKQGHFLLDFDFQSCLDDGNFFYFISSTCSVCLTLLTSFIHHFSRWHLSYTFHLFSAFLYDSRKRGGGHQFDAFVSYNVNDEDWVYKEMLPVLEGEQGWRLCSHHRDFQPGKPIIENITDAIYSSRKTICVISRHYSQSEWCSREIQMASFRSFDEQKDVSISSFLEKIPSCHSSPHYRIRKSVKKRTYLCWPEALQHPGVFWQNVHRASQTGDTSTTETC